MTCVHVIDDDCQDPLNNADSSCEGGSLKSHLSCLEGFAVPFFYCLFFLTAPILPTRRYYSSDEVDSPWKYKTVSPLNLLGKFFTIKEMLNIISGIVSRRVLLGYNGVYTVYIYESLMGVCVS